MYGISHLHRSKQVSFLGSDMSFFLSAIDGVRMSAHLGHATIFGE